MTFSRLNNRYLITVNFGTSKHVNFIMDTGSPVSIVFLDTLRNIIGFIPEEFIKSQELLEFRGYGGSCVKMLPCYIRNVNLGGTFLSKFYFLLDVTNLLMESEKDTYTSNDLIGFDIIDNCSLDSAVNGDFIVKSFSNVTYTRHWEKISRDAIEICNVT